MCRYCRAFLGIKQEENCSALQEQMPNSTPAELHRYVFTSSQGRSIITVTETKSQILLSLSVQTITKKRFILDKE